MSMKTSLLLTLFGSSAIQRAKSAANADALTRGGRVFYGDPLEGFAFTDDAGTTQAGAGNALGNWKSREGNATAATQGTAANKPTLTNQANRIAAPAFDGGDYLALPFAFSGARTVIIAAKATSLAAIRTLIDGDSLSTRTAIYIATDGSIVMNAGTIKSSAAGVITAGSAFVVEAVFNGAPSEMFVNGVSVASGTPGTQNSSSLLIGTLANLTLHHLGAQYFMAFIPGALSASERAPYRNLANLLIAGL